MRSLNNAALRARSLLMVLAATEALRPYCGPTAAPSSSWVAGRTVSGSIRKTPRCHRHRQSRLRLPGNDGGSPGNQGHREDATLEPTRRSNITIDSPSLATNPLRILADASIAKCRSAKLISTPPSRVCCACVTAEVDYQVPSATGEPRGAGGERANRAAGLSRDLCFSSPRPTSVDPSSLGWRADFLPRKVRLIDPYSDCYSQLGRLSMPMGMAADPFCAGRPKPPRQSPN